MSYITKTDLNTVIYPELQYEITRADDTIIDRAILTGIQEVKSYLSKWDLVKLFGTDTIDPVINDEWLKGITKDVIAWWIVKLANPNINYEHLRTCYEDAIKVLNKLQDGKMQPDGWIYKDKTGQTAPQGDAIISSSNPKKSLHF